MSRKTSKQSDTIKCTDTHRVYHNSSEANDEDRQLGSSPQSSNEPYSIMTIIKKAKFTKTSRNKNKNKKMRSNDKVYE